MFLVTSHAIVYCSVGDFQQTSAMSCNLVIRWFYQHQALAGELKKYAKVE